MKFVFAVPQSDLRGRTRFMRRVHAVSKGKCDAGCSRERDRAICRVKSRREADRQLSRDLRVMSMNLVRARTNVAARKPRPRTARFESDEGRDDRVEGFSRAADQTIATSIREALKNV